VFSPLHLLLDGVMRGETERTPEGCAEREDVGSVDRPFLIAHLSDPHIGAAWVPDRDPAPGLAAAVEAVRSMPRPDAVLVSGDLSEHAADAEYELARELLAPLEGPVYVLPGNHDERAALRRHFDLPGARAEPIHYAVDVGPVRLVVLDTTIPGDDPGSLDAGQLGWLDDELRSAPDVPTLLAMHHPPLATGIPAWDQFGLAAADRQALAEVVARHPHVRRIVAGHVHRAITADLAGRPVFTVPSTYVQTRLSFGSDEIELSDEPAAIAWHALVDGGLISHTQPIKEKAAR
jgi:3',5'-cyclic-AMP phosphodiesterase